MHGETYHLSQQDSIGIAILSFLSNDYHLTEKVTEKAGSKKEFYPVTFGYNIFHKQGFSISYKQNIVIGNMLDQYFREQMYTYTLLHAMGRTAQWKTSMKKYLKIFDINEDDFELESFYKDFKRRKNENKRSPIANLDKYLTENDKLSSVRVVNHYKSKNYIL